uniref:Putative secreted protein n=1 Tax=Ixodes ricinus TaxID=34613 RepID=A0A147BNZ3_IXORI
MSCRTRRQFPDTRSLCQWLAVRLFACAAGRWATWDDNAGLLGVGCAGKSDIRRMTVLQPTHPGQESS